MAVLPSNHEYHDVLQDGPPIQAGTRGVSHLTDSQIENGPKVALMTVNRPLRRQIHALSLQDDDD